MGTSFGLAWLLSQSRDLSRSASSPCHELVSPLLTLPGHLGKYGNRQHMPITGRAQISRVYRPVDGSGRLQTSRLQAAAPLTGTLAQSRLLVRLSWRCIHGMQERGSLSVALSAGLCEDVAGT